MGRHHFNTSDKIHNGFILFFFFFKEGTGARTTSQTVLQLRRNLQLRVSEKGVSTCTQIPTDTKPETHTSLLSGGCTALRVYSNDVSH